MHVIYEDPLPPGWNEEPLGKLVTTKRGCSWSKEQERDRPAESTIPVIRIPNIQASLDLTDLLYIDGISPEQRAASAVTKGWTLLVGSNGNSKRIGDSVLMDEDREMIFASFLFALRPKQDGAKITDEFIACWLHAHRTHEFISETSQMTTGLANMSWSACRKLPVRFPQRKEEQDRIAETLKAADDHVRSIEEQIRKVERVKKALIRDLFTKGIHKGSRTAYRKTEIGSVPSDWIVAPLAEICGGPDCVKTGPFGAQLPPEAFSSSGVRMLNITDIGDGEVVWKSDFYVTEETFTRLRDYELREGDIAFSRVADVGRLACIRKEQEPLLMSSNCIRLRAKATFNAKFLTHAFQDADSVSRQVVAMSNGGGRPIVTPRFLRQIRVPCPLIEEQNEIAVIFEHAEALLTSIKLQLTAARRVKQSLLQNLLSGKIRLKA